MKYVVALFLIALNSYSQQYVVADGITKEIIPFATASFYNEDTLVSGYYSNENGVVSYDNSPAFDNVKVSCIGYVTTRVAKMNLHDTLFLAPQTLMLKEIVISKKKAKPKAELLGMLQESKKLNFSSVSKGLEIVVLMKNTTGSTPLINSFILRVKKRQENKTAFRIHFYEKVQGNSEPGDEIMLGNIIVYRDRNTAKLLEADISAYNIVLPPEGLFAGIEFMGVVDDEGNFIDSEANEDHDTIEFNDAVNEPLTFSKQRFNKEGWEDTSSLKNDFKGILNFKKWPNASFSIKVSKE